MNKWIRHGGHYPTYHANIFRKGYGMCEERLYDQHYVVDGQMIKSNGDIIDIVTENITKFISRHNNWATLEALEQLSTNEAKTKKNVEPNFKGNAIERRRFLRYHYNKYPLFLRPFFYFF